ncbi:dTDP-4-dehydrorhamnose reductase [Sphingomonas solaris]|uniref:dTDP-4-dehydrorhamnose reductase n=1 Tax=Alterirhizorhabdus solaris TaxID=2529389 RepID=A0A558QXM6_9SPHN|nr:dTDP-4-dehydrorhamnose reductase [Sphingomonas solaris]TVV71858.1 dTDP-4-dehydrorhamnose reductase [Sphingomonas solaris]
MTAVLVLGGNGQLGQALGRARWSEGTVVHRPGRDVIDLARPESIATALAAHPYDIVVNAAAFTAVDAAQDDVAGAFAINATGPAILADATRRAGLPLIHVSTDYVFDGSATGAYPEDATPQPLGVYGASKLAGEYAVLSGNPRAIVLRTAWVISPFRANFLKTMLRLAAERPALRVVDDQRGSPTSADDLAEAIAAIVPRLAGDADAPTGIYHFVNAGEASWCELAREIMACSASRGGPSVPVEGIPTSAFPTPTRRPVNSRLATGRLTRDYGIEPRDWQAAVRDIVADPAAMPTAPA